MPFEPVREIVAYHEASKHYPHRYAKSLGYMDWEAQPNPFRVYDGCQHVKLPLNQTDPQMSYSGMYQPGHDIQPAPVNIRTMGEFLALSMGLSAWKSAGDSKWALRMNPSSGNLHPTEAHLVLPKTRDFKGGVYHYAPYFHSLEQRAVLPDRLWEDLNQFLSLYGFLIGLTSIFWRESWKYGERAFRYCNHDVGHALAALSLSARLQGWQMTCLSGQSDQQVKTVLGLDKISWSPMDEEHPDTLCFVGGGRIPAANRALSSSLVDQFDALEFSGIPNSLSPTYHPWDVIDRVAGFSSKPQTVEPPSGLPASAVFPITVTKHSAADIIRKRRSGVRFDDTGVFPKDRFFSLLTRTLPCKDTPPFDVDFMRPCVNLLLFIHRVEGLTPGIYFFSRVPALLETVKRAVWSEFLWQPVTEGLPLYMLLKKDMTLKAISLSCHQEIAGKSCFSLGMIVFFRDMIETAPYRYRHLFWEAGMVGQVLYLEAEAHGFRGTGIGCYFDDDVHQLMGVADNRFQSLYHFTIGTPVEDKRITTLPAYHHLAADSR